MILIPEGHEFNPEKNYYFVETYYDSLGDGCFSRSFYNAPVNVNELAEGSISVYPNPTDGLLNIRFGQVLKSQTGTLQLYNLSGQLIHHEELNILQNNSVITIRDIQYQNAGIYILRIQTDDYFFNTKIVVR